MGCLRPGEGSGSAAVKRAQAQNGTWEAQDWNPGAGSLVGTAGHLIVFNSMWLTQQGAKTNNDSVA